MNLMDAVGGEKNFLSMGVFTLGSNASYLADARLYNIESRASNARESALTYFSENIRDSFRNISVVMVIH